MAALKLAGLPSDVPSLVPILIDADEDLPCKLGPRLLREAQESHGHLDISCVIANVEYETWFVATAHSLGRFLDLSQGSDVPADPEQSRSAKAWIESRYRGVKSSEAVDQAPMTHAMDLAECRKRSRSFDKLCRELSARL